MLGLFQEQEEGQCGWSSKSEGQWRRPGEGGKGPHCHGNEPEFILMATGSHRRFTKHGNDRYDVSCTKITQVAV